MKEYYFLVSLLPQLEIGHVPSLGFQELKELLEENLNQEDKQLTRIFLRQVDIENFLAVWTKEPINPRGNLTQSQLEQSLNDLAWPGNEEFPDYMRDFLAKYSSPEERVAHFSLLMSGFLDVEKEEQRGFLRDYFTFEREWRLVMVGFRAKALGRNLDVELQYEDPKDTLVAQVLAQKDAKGYEPPFEYKELKPIFEEYGGSPLELHKAMVEWRFAQIVEIWKGQMFTIDRILNYMARLFLVEKWIELDVQKGIEVIDRIEKGIG